MKRLEDIVKERLADYESDLPEGTLSEFRAKLDAARNVSGPGKDALRTSRRINPLWLTALASAVCLALIFVPKHNKNKDGMVDIAERSVAEIREEPVDAATIAMDDTSVEPMVIHSSDVNNHASSEIVVMSELESEGSELKDSEVKDSESMDDDNAHEADTVEAREAIEKVRVPLYPENKVSHIHSGKVALTTIGGTSAIAIAALAPTLSYSIPISQIPYDPLINNPDSSPATSGYAAMSGNATYKMPFRACISLRAPITDRWSITTGAGFMSYTSLFEISNYPDQISIKQVSQYLNLSARMDYTIYSNDVFDIYAGAGAAADFCIAARFAGERAARDGVGLSLLASAGFQLNLTDNFGIFFEPLLSYAIPSDKTVLQTYKTAHPLMFSVNPGLRFTLPHR